MYKKLTKENITDFFQREFEDIYLRVCKIKYMDEKQTRAIVNLILPGTEEKYDIFIIDRYRAKNNPFNFDYRKIEDE